MDSRTAVSAAAHYDLLSPSTLPPCAPSLEERSGQARNCLCGPLSDELGDTPSWSPRALARNCLTAVMIIKTAGSVVAHGACSLATASFLPSPASSCPARPFLAQVLSSFPPQCLCTGCSLEWEWSGWNSSPPPGSGAPSWGKSLQLADCRDIPCLRPSKLCTFPSDCLEVCNSWWVILASLSIWGSASSSPGLPFAALGARVSVKLKSILGVGRAGHPGGSLAAPGRSWEQTQGGSGLGPARRALMAACGRALGPGDLHGGREEWRECISHQAAGLRLCPAGWGWE